MPDLQAAIQRLLDQLPTLAAQLESALKGWAEAEFAGSADDGGIVARVNGLGVLSQLEISVQSRRTLDNLTLGDRIAEAIRNAEAEAERQKFTALNTVKFGEMSMGQLMREGPAAALKVAEPASFADDGAAPPE